MKRKNEEIKATTLSPEAHMTDLKRYLEAVKIGINPHVPSVDKIREALADLGELPRMEMKNHCILLREAGHIVRAKASQSCFSRKERQLVYRVLEAL